MTVGRLSPLSCTCEASSCYDATRIAVCDVVYAVGWWSVHVFTYEMRYAGALALWKIVSVWTSCTSWTRFTLGVDELWTVLPCDFGRRAECRQGALEVVVEGEGSWRVCLWVEDLVGERRSRGGGGRHVVGCGGGGEDDC